MTVCSTSGQPEPIRIRSYFISPCEGQLNTAVSIANSYMALYYGQVLISTKLARADSISQAQFKFADRQYREESQYAAYLESEVVNQQSRGDSLQRAVYRYRGRTWVGRKARIVRNRVLAPTGGAALLYLTLKLLF